MAEWVSKPEGGFVTVPAMALMAAWWAYKRGFIRLADFRVWLACFELVARRRRMREGRVPRYLVRELRTLTAASGEAQCRASVRRLQDLGLLSWSERSVSVGEFDGVESLDARGELEAKRRQLVNHRRGVPVPRRMLCVMCGCARPVLLATWLGHLLRCLYSRGLKCRPTGLCKASWVAQVFEVNERNVKGARAQLVEWGMVTTRSAPQRVLNRHGLPVTVNLAWSKDHPRKMPPPSAQAATETPPPNKTGISASRSEHQQRARKGADGVRTRTGSEPDLRRVRIEDLHNVRRLDSLWRAAAERNHCGWTECDRLRVFGAAAHALRVATRNVCGLFATVVRRGLWSHISVEDEERGRRGVRKADELWPSGSGSRKVCRGLEGHQLYGRRDDDVVRRGDAERAGRPVLLAGRRDARACVL